jgi:hypothetical protein
MLRIKTAELIRGLSVRFSISVSLHIRVRQEVQGGQ